MCTPTGGGVGVGEEVGGGGKEFLYKLLLGHLSGIELECQGPDSSQEVI